jgi:1,4-alpha-glucan branching enzyme
MMRAVPIDAARPHRGTGPGTFSLVLHTHLPWLAHHGRWPVGEEWLYQAWARSYLPIVRMLERLAGEGRRDLLTLGLTPVLADQLDDPYCLDGLSAWVADWRLRAEHLAARRDEDARRIAAVEFRAASRALDDVATGWRHGGSPRWRALADAGVIEVLGGPATHPVLPLLDPRVARIALAAGLDDARTRLGREPGGIWAPECGWRPGLEEMYAAAGVTHLVADEATLTAAGRSTATGHRLGDTDVVMFGRDLSVTDRIWSSRHGYPGGADYRDFHEVDPASGFRLRRVTGPGAAGPQKAPWDPAAADAAIERDAADFVTAVADRLRSIEAEQGRPGLVVAAYDTELFGHWWHEGPAFLERVLRLLPEAGVRPASLRTALEDGLVAPGAARPPAGTWGAGKDFRLWSEGPVADLARDGEGVQKRLLAALDEQVAQARGPVRRRDLDQLVRESLLHLSGDWAFAISRDQAPDYAWRRALGHRDAVHAIADALAAGPAEAGAVADRIAAPGTPFARLDARALEPAGPS